MGKTFVLILVVYCGAWPCCQPSLAFFTDFVFPAPDPVQQPPNRSSFEFSIETMPNMWDKRYVAVSASHGMELLAVLRDASQSTWVVLTPSGSLMSVSSRYWSTQPLAGIVYAQSIMPSAARKTALEATVRGSIQADQHFPVIEINRRRRNGFVGFLGVIFMTFPRRVLGFLKWCFSSRTRGLVTIGAITAAVEVAYLLGVIDGARNAYNGIKSGWAELRLQAEEVSETLFCIMDWTEYILRGLWSMGLRRVFILVVGMLASGMWLANGGSLSSPVPTPSPLSSGASSPGSDAGAARPARSAEETEFFKAVVEKLEKHGDLLTRISSENASLKTRLVDVQTETQGAVLSSEAVRESEATAHREAVAALRARINTFEEIIAVDREKQSAAVPKHPPPLPPPASSPAQPGQASASSDPASAVAEVVRKLEEQAQPPQQSFLERLKEYREEDKTEWARHFPPGYRTRIAPSFLAEVYSGGKKARQWGRDLLKDKGLVEHGGGKDFIGTMTALDSILLTDRSPGAINLVSTERLARKALGYVKMVKEVNKEGDWKRPSGEKSKNWRSKMNTEAQRRTDPSFLDEEESFVHREAEEESKQEIEKDASLLKAYAKIAEWRHASQEKGGD